MRATNLVCAGYGTNEEEDGEDQSPGRQAETDRPGIIRTSISRLARLALTLFACGLVLAFVGLLALVARPEWVPRFRAKFTNAITKVSGLSAQEIEAKRKQYGSFVTSRMTTGGTVTIAGSQPKTRLTFSERLTIVAARHSNVPRETLAAIIALMTTKAKEQGVDPALLAAMAAADSKFDPSFRSQDGRYGLFQLDAEKGDYIAKLGGLAWKGPEELMNLEYNIDMTVGYLKFLQKIFKGDTQAVVMAKLLGPRAFLETMKSGTGLPQPAVVYSEKVGKLYSQWQGELGISDSYLAQ